MKNSSPTNLLIEQLSPRIKELTFRCMRECATQEELDELDQWLFEREDNEYLFDECI